MGLMTKFINAPMVQPSVVLGKYCDFRDFSTVILGFHAYCYVISNVILGILGCDVNSLVLVLFVNHLALRNQLSVMNSEFPFLL
jgi:hypothetical protein